MSPKQLMKEESKESRVFSEAESEYNEMNERSSQRNSNKI